MIIVISIDYFNMDCLISIIFTDVLNTSDKIQMLFFDSINLCLYHNNYCFKI